MKHLWLGLALFSLVAGIASAMLSLEAASLHAIMCLVYMLAFRIEILEDRIYLLGGLNE